TMSWVLAVDFGTSNTSAAHRTGPDRIESLPLTHTSNLMPSAVYLDPHGTITTGDVAVNHATLDPAGYIAAPKAHVTTGTVHTRGHDIPTATTIAAVLRTVHTRALTAHNNQPPTDIVLTHPEAWSPRELAVLRHAATLAGLGGHVCLISEPRAAAFHYSRHHDAKIVAGSTIAVFDFGGGTLDVAVLTATDEWTFEVLRAAGDNALGGKNLDATDAPSATIRVTGNGTEITVTLTREEFEQMIEPQIGRAVQLAATVLREAGVDRGGLQALYLTGGSSRIPYVHRRLAELGPIATLDDPKTVVARGAAGFVAGGRGTDPAAQRATEVLEREPRHPRQAPASVFHGPAFARPPAPAAAQQKSRTPLMIVGAAVAAVLVAAAAIFFVTRPDTDPASAAAAQPGAAVVIDATEPADSSAPAATADSTFISESTDDVTSLLPTKLITSSTACEKSGFSSGSSALQVRCLVNVNSNLGKAVGMEANEYLGVTAWRDDEYARSHLIQLRDNKTGAYTTITSPDGSRIVGYDPSGPYVMFDVVDRSRGLIVQFSTETAEQGLALLKELGYVA
ncbi:Hsp70 family protein, partial [Rhodococcus phenolicus]|uniref:Hsp70 family protein n=1 Tax=Rhodococcus phenolicus TaxID=263849 RepID=UPI000AE9F652